MFYTFPSQFGIYNLKVEGNIIIITFSKQPSDFYMLNTHVVTSYTKCVNKLMYI